jgi:ABC-2 type transport system permease protein
MHNIFNLIWKDILILKHNLWFAALYGFVALFAFSTFKNGALSAALVGVSYTLITQACAQDDKNKSEIMVISLPILRREVVLAKYLSTILFAIIGLLSYFLALIAVTLLGIPIYVQKITLAGLVGPFFALVLLVSIYFPIYFKLGYLRSRMVGMFLFFACFFFIPLSVNLSTDFFARKHNVLIQSIATALKRFGEWLPSQTDWQIFSYLFALVLIMITLSTGLSLKFYAHREF